MQPLMLAERQSGHGEAKLLDSTHTPSSIGRPAALAIKMRPTIARRAGYQSVHMDPALVRYANMYVKRHEYFRWTPRTAWISFAYIVAIPASLIYFGSITDGKWEFRGKRRGDILSER